MRDTTNDASDKLLVRVFRIEEGLGNAILLEFPDQTCAIVDWGTQNPEALKVVLQRAKKRIRVVVATHDHADHTLGLAELLTACKKADIPIDLFAYPTSHLRDRCNLTRARIRAYELGIRMSSIGVRQAPGGTPLAQQLALETDSWQLAVLAPLTADAAQAEVVSYQKRRAAGNRSSVIILFAFSTPLVSGASGVGKVLLTGDATNALLQGANDIAQQHHLDLNNQLLVVPHHGGSRVVPDWLEKHVHGIAVISGRTNSPHHPKATTLQRLARVTCEQTPSKLFCTSYAQACRSRFGSNSKPHEKHLVKAGPCFGDLEIRVPRLYEAVLESSAEPGEKRRPFGWCGNHMPKLSEREQ